MERLFIVVSELAAIDFPFGKLPFISNYTKVILNTQNG